MCENGHLGPGARKDYLDGAAGDVVPQHRAGCV